MTNVSIGNIENQKTIINKLDGLLYDSQGNALSLEDLKGLLDGIQTGQATYDRQTEGLGKADEVLARLADQSVIARAVKSIQSGSRTGTGDTGEHRINISKVDPSKCILIAQTRGSSSGFDGIVTDFSFGNNDTLLKMNITGKDVFWQLVEFY